MLNATTLYQRTMRGLLVAAGARPRHVAYCADLTSPAYRAEGDAGPYATRGEATSTAGSVHVLDVPGRGSLPTVVLLHGFSACGASQYAPIVRYLQPRVRRLLVPDLPGHGLSSVPPEGLNGAVLMAGVTAALALLDEPAIVFATSMGGVVGLRYALERPASVRGLVLCSPTGAPVTPAQMAMLRVNFHIETHRDALAFVDRLFPYRHRLRQLLAFGVREQFGKPHLRELLERAPRERFLSAAEVRSLSMPLHLLWGKQDRILPRAHLEFFRRHLPAHGTLDEPEDYGHGPFLDQPADVGRRIEQFAGEVVHGWRAATARAAAASCARDALAEDVEAAE